MQDKVQRLLQLVTLLLETRVPLPFTEIQRQLPEDYGDPDDLAHRDASKRKFERDKDDLRGIGVPIELQPLDLLVDGEQGYRIMRERYYLPDIAFTADEAAALTVLSTETGEDDAAIQGLRKLTYGVQGGPLSSRGSVVAPGPERAGSRLGPLVEAILEHRAVTFGYHNAAGARTQRTVDPYRVVTRDGHWYLVGSDRDSHEIRVFRSSRIDGEVSVTEFEASSPPDGFDAAAHVMGPWETGTGAQARVAFDPEVAWWALRSIRDAREDSVRDDGWRILHIPVTSDLVSSVLRFGADAELISPPELRAELIQALEQERDRVSS